MSSEPSVSSRPKDLEGLANYALDVGYDNVLNAGLLLQKIEQRQVELDRREEHLDRKLRLCGVCVFVCLVCLLVILTVQFA